MRGVKTKTGNKWKQLGISLVLILLFVVLLNSVYGVYKKKKSAEELLSRMQTEIVTLKERESFLTDSIKKLGTVEGIKFEIRKKLNVALSGESVAIIVTDQQSSSTNPTKPSSLQRLKNFFKNLFD